MGKGKGGECGFIDWLCIADEKPLRLNERNRWRRVCMCGGIGVIRRTEESSMRSHRSTGKYKYGLNRRPCDFLVYNKFCI